MSIPTRERHAGDRVEQRGSALVPAIVVLVMLNEIVDFLQR